jgi:ribosomal protein S18 acetylase RimI-like enzyme
VRLHEHFSFNLLDFRFFQNSEHGVAMPFGNSPLLASLIVVPYLLIADVYFFKTARFFLILKGQVVGTLAVREENEALFISSLAVAPEYRRHGIAMYVLGYVSKLAARLNKKWVELSVLKTNVPAQRLYLEFGFTRHKEKKLSIILRKSI